EPGLAVLIAIERQRPLDQAAVRRLEQGRECLPQRRADERREHVVGRARRAQGVERVLDAPDDTGLRICQGAVEVEEQHERRHATAVSSFARIAGPSARTMAY